MIESELTENQRESREPIGKAGFYRMYRWECSICKTHGVKSPYSVAMEAGIAHSMSKHEPDITNPPVRIIGGVFEKKELYT